jgi:tetratricopeptide (TPR) repeat protein
MARFDHLELEQPSDDPRGGQGQPAQASRDEEYWLGLADQNRREGLYENALRFYSRALERDKSIVDGWVGQVQMLIHLGEYPEAELWSRKALELFRNNSELLAGRAQAYCRLGDRKHAQEFCDGSLRQEGHSAYRWTVRGELLVTGNDNVDRHCFDKALQLDPDWLVPLEISLLYRHYRKPSKALSRAKQAVERAPDAPYAWYIQGCCELDLELISQASNSLRRCLELSPNHAEASRQLASLKDRGSLGRRLRRFFRRS